MPKRPSSEFRLVDGTLESSPMQYGNCQYTSNELTWLSTTHIECKFKTHTSRKIQNLSGITPLGIRREVAAMAERKNSQVVIDTSCLAKFK